MLQTGVVLDVNDKKQWNRFEWATATFFCVLLPLVFPWLNLGLVGRVVSLLLTAVALAGLVAAFRVPGHRIMTSDLGRAVWSAAIGIYLVADPGSTSFRFVVSGLFLVATLVALIRWALHMRATAGSAGA